jgi:hypothetical protein
MSDTSQDHATTSLLCKTCQGIFIEDQLILGSTNEDSEFGMQEHHKNLSSLRKFALQGCYVCSSVCALLDNEIHPHNYEPAIDRRNTWYMGAHNQGNQLTRFYMLWIVVQTMSSEEHDVAKSEYWEQFLIGHNANSKLLATGYPLSPSTADKECFLVAKKWIQQCRETHYLCNLGASSTNRYPTRLLKIHSSGALFKVRLHICSEGPIDEPYITLSHRCGEAPILRLTAAKLTDMQKDIPFETLPKTF